GQARPRGKARRPEAPRRSGTPARAQRDRPLLAGAYRGRAGALGGVWRPLRLRLGAAAGAAADRIAPRAHYREFASGARRSSVASWPQQEWQRSGAQRWWTMSTSTI